MELKQDNNTALKVDTNDETKTDTEAFRLYSDFPIVLTVMIAWSFCFMFLMSFFSRFRRL